MKSVLAGLLGVIAAGVMLIAVELLPGRATAVASDFQGLSIARPVNNPIALGADQAPSAYDAGAFARPVPVAYTTYEPAAPVRPAVRAASLEPRRATTTRIEKPGRDWAKTALVIGGTSAAGAGLGAIIGGKKGALIGAALGGGAGTLFEVKKDR